MSVSDRWHLARPGKSDQPCKCGTEKNPLYPTAEHPDPEKGRKGGKRWQVRWRDDDGKQCSKNFAKKTGKDPLVHADAFDAQVNVQIDTDNYVDPKAGQITLEEYAKQWRASLTAKRSSLDVIDKRLAHIYDVEAGPRTRRPEGSASPIAGKTMARLAKRPSMLREWIKGLERKGLSPKYIHDIAGTLSSIFATAIGDGVVSVNPVRSDAVKLPTIPKRTIVPWTREQLADGREQLREQDRAIIELGVAAGLRAGEIFGLAEDDLVFLGKRLVRVRRQVRRTAEHVYFDLPKYGKQREIPMSEALSVRLAAHIKAYPPEPVTLPWGGPDGKPHTAKLLFRWREGEDGWEAWNPNAFAYWWRRCQKAAGMEGVPGNGMHVLRHTAASVWLAAGVDVRKLAAWLGHEDPGFTLRTYTHFIPDFADRGRAAMDAFLDGEDADGNEGTAAR